MTLDVPLAVRVWGGSAGHDDDRRITALVSDLQFGTQAPGGYAGCTISLHQPIALNAEELTQFGRLYVYDTRNGETVYEGRLEDPAKTAGTDGQIWQLTATGGSAHVNDVKYPVIYVDRQLEGWRPLYDGSAPVGTPVRNGSVDNRSEFMQIKCQVPGGTPVVTGSRVAVAYWRLREAGGTLGGISWSWDGGGSTPNYSVRGYTLEGSGIRFDDLSTAGGVESYRTIGTNWVSGHQVPVLMLYRVGAGETANVDTNWVIFDNLIVHQTYYSRAGVLKTSGYSSSWNYSKSWLVVEDLLGRYLDLFDGPNAYIEITSNQIDQLAYPEGASPGEILEDLAVWDPAYYWAAWESNPLNDRFRFEYKAWPKTPKYEADISDGFEDGGGASELYTDCRVRWTAPNGMTKMYNVHQSVPVLDNAPGGPLTRTYLMDLGSNMTTTTAGATTIGQNFLAEHKYPANAGRLRISHPVWDLERAAFIQPWELKAGNLIRVRGVLPNPDGLNPASGADFRDAVTTFRIISTQYNQSENAAVLELDTYSRSVSRALARVTRRMDRFRRP